MHWRLTQWRSQAAAVVAPGGYMQRLCARQAFQARCWLIAIQNNHSAAGAGCVVAGLASKHNLGPLACACFVGSNRAMGHARRLYESIHPLEEQLVARLDAPLSPLCAVAGLAFDRNADAVSGPWRNFFIGLLGDVAAAEEDVLWPNQVRARLLVPCWCPNQLIPLR